ncbi:MAG: BLUF domain-containing protein [Variovorax sp.]
MSDLHEILYCSLLAPQQPPTVVGKIVAQARARNAAEGVTGLLVFDGMRFCQHFEGPSRQVLRLMSRLETDPRHTHIRVVYEGALAARRYQRFDLGLAQIEESDDLAEVQKADGIDALQRFLALRPRFDVAG